jgi:glycosyltransferase involved in cell wall biosynthesis
MGDRSGRLPARPTVAAIIPAYNERETVGAVVRAVRAAPVVDRVVVVSDGSADGTDVVAREQGATVIVVPENRGKGAAMRLGWESVTEDIVLFLDADLVGLTPAHVIALVEPVVAGRVDATVGIFEGGRLPTDLAQALLPVLSGQRAVRRDLLRYVDSDDGGFGIEVAMHRALKRVNARIEPVVLQDLSQVLKEEKLGLYRGLAARMRMYWDILRELPKV